MNPFELQEIGRGGGTVVYLDNNGALVIHPGKPAGPRQQKQLHFDRADAIALAMAILAWEEPTNEPQRIDL